MEPFNSWILSEMGYGRFESPQGVNLIVKGIQCPAVSFADARIERWPAAGVEGAAIKRNFQTYAGNPGHPFYGKVDNGYLLFIPASYSIRFAPTPPIEGEAFQMPNWWLDHLLLTDADNNTLYDAGRKPMAVAEIAMPPGGPSDDIVGRPMKFPRARGSKLMVPPIDDSSFNPIRLPYSFYVVFQRYVDGQNDPLYHVLSRRGNSVDWKIVALSDREIQRIKQVSQQIMASSEDKGEVATARAMLQNLATP